MLDEKEVQPLSSGTKGVSAEVEMTPVVDAPAALPAEATPASAEPKKRTRGVDLSSLSPEELKAHKKTINDKAQRKRSDKKKAASYVYDSGVEPTKAEAKEILTARGLQNPHVIDVVYKSLLRAAEQKSVPANRFLFQNGIKAMLASYGVEAPQALEAIPAEGVAGELLTRTELYALYDASVAPHEPETTFDDFLNIRLNCKKDTFYLGKEIFKNDFAGCHRTWQEFFPQLDPTTLPPDYTQKQAIEWLASQSDIKDFLLMASRRAFKSSFARLWLISLIVTQPDIRILIVSETRPLSKDNIEAVRGYFEAQPGFETRFQRLFPEFCIPVGDGSVMSLEVPMRRLKLPQSIESSSMDSAVAGRRADVILFDDPISEVSCTNEVQIKKSVDKRDMLVKLKERGGLVVTLGTPYAANDLYAQMIERSDKNKDETFAYRIDPAFTVKPHARHKLTPALLPSLVEADIESFLFPEGLPWKELRVDMMNNPPFFMSQNLCIFPLEQDSELRCQFEHDELWARVRPASFFGRPLTAQVVMSLDRAFSVSKYADLSCIVVGKVQAVENKLALVAIDSKMDRWKESELVRNIVEMIEKHRPTVLVAEQDKGWAELSDAIRKQCVMRNIPAPWLRFRPADNSDKAKARRVKKLELPLSDSRLWFVSSHWTEAALLQLEKFDGITASNSHRKDDFPDALGSLWEAFGPKHQEEVKKEDEEKRKAEQAEEETREARRQFHDRMFGGSYTQPKPVEPPPTPQAQQPARQFPRGGNFASLPNVFRRNR